MKRAILLVAHGTVEDLGDLEAFVTNVRRGHPAPPELIAELRRRYEAIGGSPLLKITRALAAKIQKRTQTRTAIAMRLWRPYPKEVLGGLVGEGVGHVAVVPLAQHSAHVYTEFVERTAAEMTKSGGRSLKISCASDWGSSPTLTNAFADKVRLALTGLPADEIAKTTLVMTAHSLPVAVIRAGDAYEREVRASAESIAKLLNFGPKHVVAFQSQGASGGEWLGPDLKTTIEGIAARGDKRVVVAPIGFLADHVEILYDLDIEAAGWAKAAGLEFSRTESLNDNDALADAVAEVARPLFEAS